MVETAGRLRVFSFRVGLGGRLADTRLVLGLTAALAVGGLAFANGGYFPVSWGWSALGLLWLALIALALGVRPEVGRRELVLLAGLGLLAGWIALSVLWTSSVTGTVLEVERTLVYLGAALAGILLVRRASAPALLLGLWAAISVVAAYGLATRLFPDRLGVYDPIAASRLSDPVGYWNAFGILGAMGLLLALGHAARSRPLVRCTAAASTVVLALTIYFTFSRGSWIALFTALAATVAVDRRRLQLVTTGLVLLPWAALAIWAASTSTALTHRISALEQATHDGHGLAAITIGLAVGAALSVLALDWLEEAVSVPRTLQRLYGGTLVFLLAAALLVVVGHYGSPVRMVDRAYQAFNTPAPNSQEDLNNRLFNLSSNGRKEHYHTAWQQAAAHPVLGGGAGSYGSYWFQHRRTAAPGRDAHSLYLETFAELGIPGLLFLAVALGVPLAAVRRARSSPLAAAAFGAYAAYLLHAAIDWDWEMPAVTLTALFCGLALLAAARGGGERRPLRPSVRWVGLGATAALAGVALLGLLGNAALSASSQSAHGGHYTRAASQARWARHFAPWSAEPWRKLGEAELSSGQSAAARTSFQSAIDKNPKDWTLWFELAQASSGGARTAALTKATRLNPLSPELKARARVDAKADRAKAHADRAHTRAERRARRSR
ncbi:MAG TPA: O-antigen ligase family protein [Gaiellaceae bacterium]|nr:O-antigen ligase family protein [Gaiellaceae bacterium]